MLCQDRLHAMQLLPRSQIRQLRVHFVATPSAADNVRLVHLQSVRARRLNSHVRELFAGPLSQHFNQEAARSPLSTAGLLAMASRIVRRCAEGEVA
jgi:hypothetical protein